MEFALVQPAQLVEDRLGHLGHADVVQRRAQSEDAQLLSVQRQVAAEGEGDRTASHAEQCGVFADLLELAQTDERIGVADDAVEHTPDDLVGELEVDRLPAHDLLGRVVHQAACFGLDLLGSSKFLFERGSVLIGYVDFLSHVPTSKLQPKLPPRGSAV